MKKTRKLLSLLVVLALAFALSMPAFAHDDPDPPYGKDVLQEVTEGLAEFGVRHDGGKNVMNAANYICEQFSKYDSFVSEMVPVPLKYPGGYMYQTIQRPAVIEIAGAPELYGRPYPNNAEFGNTGFTGVFYDFGGNADFTVPDVTSGGIYGTVRFNVAPTLPLVTAFISAVEAKYEGDVKVTGLFVSRDSAATGTAAYTPPSISGTGTFPAPVATLDLTSLEQLKAAGAAGKIGSIYRLDPVYAYSAFATKPAATDNPDLVIVCSSHIDSVWGSPGCNDNGSGTVAMVELARRFNDVDTGNIELILSAGGGEEYGDFEGSAYIIERLIAQGKTAIAIDFNLDMVAPAYDARTSSGAALSTVNLSTRSGSQRAGGTWNAQYNLAAYLAMADVWSIERPGTILNVQTSNSTGVSDHHLFHYFGMDSVSLEHGAEFGYHTSYDNIVDNYSHARHLYSVEIITKAIEKAISGQLSKYAKFETEAIGGTTELTLANAGQLFNTFDNVSATIAGPDGNRNIVFTAENPVALLPEGDYTATAATGNVRAVANYSTMAQQNFTTRMVPETAEAFVGASVNADEESGIEGDVCYTLSLSGARDLLNVELEFVVDGSMLAGKGLETLNGFNSVDGIDWRFIGGNLWKGSVTLGYPSGGNTGFTSEGPVDVAVFTFAPRAVGDAAFTIVGFKAVGLRGDETCYLDARIVNGEAVTNIDQRVFSKYDLNRDNKVDALDLGIMLLYCGFATETPGWDSLVKVNDSRGKGVTASMCDVNDDGIIDMLDLLDLFIHYTK
ncbi:MAG: M28 family peptidase [Clostridiales bacterium]|nr:M28 family peptidase [Clostridiales bacterium]